MRSDTNSARRSNSSRFKLEEKYALFLLVLPAFLYIVLFHYVPIWGWSFAFFKYKPGMSLLTSEFVGFENFKMLFGNPVLRNSLIRVIRNTFVIQGFNILFMFVPMFFAIVLSEMKSRRFQKVVQTLTTLPHFISWVILFSLASSIFGSTGLVNSMLTNMGMDKINILNSPDNVWLTQALLHLWKSMGWSAIIYFAAIAGLDQEVFEASMVDGANRWQRIWHITFPMLIPTYFVLLIMGIGNFLNSGIDQYLAFGNALNKDAIEVLDLYVYNLGIGSGQISYSVAVGLMKSVVAIVLFAGANFASKKIRGTSVF